MCLLYEGPPPLRAQWKQSWLYRVTADLRAVIVVLFRFCSLALSQFPGKITQKSKVIKSLFLFIPQRDGSWLLVI